MRLRVVLADDEELVRRSVRRFLRNHDVEWIEECGDGCEALDAIQSRMPNLVFMDLRMPNMGGMDVIETIGEQRMPATIIITAHDSHAVDAYNFNIVDYLLKPFGRERFEKAISRARQRIDILDKPAELIVDKQEYLHSIAVPRNGRIYFIETGCIEWIEAKGNIVVLHCYQDSYKMRQPLTTLHRYLDPKIFVRVHRSTLVNVRCIREIQPWFKGHHLVVLKSGQEIRMSRYQQEGVNQLMGGLLGLK